MSDDTVAIESFLSKLPAPLSLVLPDGRRIGVAGAGVELQTTSWAPLHALAALHTYAFAESFVRGEVQLTRGSIRDMLRLLPALVRQRDGTDVPLWLEYWLKLQSWYMHTTHRDSRQIEFHYDLSDDFFALWLDPHRAYSCAYFPHDEATLQEAQEAKFDLICRKLRLARGQRLLDVGAGWGGLILWAAKHYGVQATGITLSKNQHAHVNRLVELQGLRGQVEMRLEHYRQFKTEMPFDRIASVGMFEHVGRAQMLNYFDSLKRLLHPDGLLLNHGITLGHPAQTHVDKGISEFINRQIFPGGELLHISEVLRHMAAAGLEPFDTENLRPHYARTLWRWSDALEANLERAAQLVPPARVRAYRLYLAGSAVGFEQNWLQLFQVLAAPDTTHSADAGSLSRSAYPYRRDYIYAGAGGIAAA